MQFLTDTVDFSTRWDTDPQRGSKIRAVTVVEVPARTGTQAVDRALHLLDLLEAEAGDVGVTALAGAARLSVSTTHRLVHALAAAGLVAQDPDTERYHLGPRLIALGRRAEARFGLARWHGELQRIAAATGESASLGVRLGREVLIADHVPSAQPLRFDAGIGSRVPIHASAMGKAMLALAGDPVVEVAGLGELERFTERTLTDRAALAGELEAIRRRGWAINDGERNPGVRAVAVTIPTNAADTAAAIAVQGPEVRLTDDRIDAVVGLLVSTLRSAAPESSTS
jgi:IclR family acetate operon transcriptional repressor